MKNRVTRNMALAWLIVVAAAIFSKCNAQGWGNTDYQKFDLALRAKFTVASTPTTCVTTGVVNTDIKKLICTVNNISLSSGDTGAWHQSGDAITAQRTFGSTTAQNISLITNNNQRALFTANGRVWWKISHFDQNGVITWHPTLRTLSDTGGRTIIGYTDMPRFYNGGVESFRMISPGHLVSNWSGTNGTSISYGSNNGFDSTLAQNTVFGYQCLGGNGEQPGYPRTLTTGEKNAMFGSLCGFHVTSGSRNSLMGAECGEFFTTATNCAGFGFHALNGNKTSDQCTAFGAGAMQGQFRASGSQLVACNTFPVHSTAVGYNALSIDTAATGGTNDAFGNQSLELMQGGDGNAAFGNNSLGRAPSGNNNTVFGSNAGGLVKGSPVGNTLIGALAGYGDNTNGFSHNTIIGTSAGQGLTTGSDNIIIGYQANATIWGNLNNKLWIDVGNNSTPLVWGDFATRQVAFGTTAPSSSALVEVTSTTKGFRITPMTATQASAITPVEGLILFVSSTDGTFTSIGLWDYENGAWHKM